MVPAVLLGQDQWLTQDGHGGYRRAGAQRDIRGTPLEMQAALGIGARSLGENYQTAAGIQRYARILNQTHRIIVGEESSQPQVAAHHRVAEQALLGDAIRNRNKSH